MPQEAKDKIDFVVFLVNKLSTAWGMLTPDVYQTLNKADLIDGYIIPCYDVLHTQGAPYLVEDLTELAKERGALK